MELSLNLSAIPAKAFAIAFSGGGDSTALLHALRARAPHVLKSYAGIHQSIKQAVCKPAPAAPVTGCWDGAAEHLVSPR
jgi:PP-loop superfamily ATP-utilizing enzyme